MIFLLMLNQLFRIEKEQNFSQENIDYSKSVTGVAYSKNDAKVTLVGVQDKPGVAADILSLWVKIK